METPREKIDYRLQQAVKYLYAIKAENLTEDKERLDAVTRIYDEYTKYYNGNDESEKICWDLIKSFCNYNEGDE